ncbi:MAG: hypothetical protein ACYTF6_15260 [Planctomycetota bacterium]|jgi:hypothetical protein
MTEQEIFESDVIVEKWFQAKEALERVFQNWLQALRPLYDAVLQVCQIFYDAFWQAYLEAGTPYGENDEGMWRWARECAEAERLRREADDIELYHRQMASFRRMLTKKGAERHDG